MRKPAFLRMYDEIDTDLDELEEKLKEDSQGQTDPRIYDWCSAHLHLVSLLRHKTNLGRRMDQTALICFAFMVLAWVGAIVAILAGSPG